jgi:PPK2 family polyphosphate:nucleotide phosphotransferase
LLIPDDPEALDLMGWILLNLEDFHSAERFLQRAIDKSTNYAQAYLHLGQLYLQQADTLRAHDFLWRIHRYVPRKGEIRIFNRSHYEDVLIVRVHNLVPKSLWSARFEQINNFEKMLVENDIHVIKFFLHISKDEQHKRLKERLEDPTKFWKADPADFKESKFWDEYTEAYDDVLTRCSTKHAPWYVIPANKKWFRNLAISEIMVSELARLKMKFPEPRCDISKLRIR